PGDVVTGQISNIVDFGAFVDLEGMDGLIHISELSWSHVNHPSEVLEIGQTVNVKVLDIDRDRQRISLGLKQTQSDPWQQVVEAYSENDVVEGKVTKVVTFGAFVEIVPGVEGLVHISELAQHHVENPREIVSQGDVVRVAVLEIDADRRRLSLSMKRVEGGGVVSRAEAPEPVAEEEPEDEGDEAAELVEFQPEAEEAQPEAEEAEPEPEMLADAVAEPVEEAAEADPEIVDQARETAEEPVEGGAESVDAELEQAPEDPADPDSVQ
ncbi:MAG: S1 RNA-binding domain-containing protein, partial [Gaiellaceae bacterium]